MVNKKSRTETRVKKHRRVRNHLSASTLDKDVKEACEKTNNVAAAALVGTAIAKKALEKGITTVVFDRGGFIYHGKVQALADAAREAGLDF